MLTITVFAAAGLLCWSAPADAARPQAHSPEPGRVVAGAGPVRDGRTDTRRLHRALAAGYGGRIRTAGGTYVNVSLSGAYAPDPAVLQKWADFFAGLEHGPEIGRVTVYVAPLAEVSGICGEGSDGCYSPHPARLTVTGGDSSSYRELVAAHEYGHHLDASRRNDPWDASTWGPKHWATWENVCHRTRIGTAFPGDEGEHYGLNPDEAWAEAYAVLNGYQWESQTFDDSFKPDAGALKVMRLDIHQPWNGPAVHRYRGSFARGQLRKTVRLPEPLDGRLSVKLRVRGAADVNLYTVVKGRRKLLKRARHRGAKTNLRFTICGQYPLQLQVVRRRGSGRFAMTVLEP